MTFPLSHLWAASTPPTAVIAAAVESDSLQLHGPAVCQASLSFIIFQSVLKLISIELMMPSNHFVLCCPLLLLPSIFPSIRVFSNESALRIRWPKYWSVSFSISPSNEYSGLISSRIDWFDLSAVQGTLKHLLQHPFLLTGTRLLHLNPRITPSLGLN